MPRWRGGGVPRAHQQGGDGDGEWECGAGGPRHELCGLRQRQRGDHTVAVVATDYSGNGRTNAYQVVVTNGSAAQTLTCDLNGNLIVAVTATSTNIYQWDAADPLIGITQLSRNGQLVSAFLYDGLGRRVCDLEGSNGVTLSTNWYVWCGATLCEERDSTGAKVTKRFFSRGEQIGAGNYYFTRDHLGSVREMTDSSGAIRARYNYDPYRAKTKVQGDVEADFGFGGYYCHAPSGLLLALFRAYNALMGRWLNRIDRRAWRHQCVRLCGE